MNLFGMLEVSGSALAAERWRAEVVAANMANAETTHTVQGGAYQRQLLLFRAQPMPPFSVAASAAPLGSGWRSESRRRGRRLVADAGPL